MKQKDYIKIADIIKDAEISLNQNGCTFAIYAEQLADYFEKEYPLLKLGINKGGFNKLDFIKRCCGVKKK